jgi:type VI secretion system protein VasI
VCLFITDWWIFGFAGLIYVSYKSSGDLQSFKKQAKYGIIGFFVLFGAFAIYAVIQTSPTSNNQTQVNAGSNSAPKETPKKTHAEALAEYVGSWKTATQKSKLDDSQNVIIGIDADEPIQTPYKGMVYPRLMIRCAENKTSMIVSFDTFLSNDDIKVTYRIDKEKARNVWWNVTTDFDSLYVPNPIPLLRKLKDEDQIFIQVTPYGQKPISANFYVHGLFNAIKPVQEACGWK